MKDKLTKEDLLKAKNSWDDKVPESLGNVCPYCNEHIEDGAILNPKWHNQECPIRKFNIRQKVKDFNKNITSEY